MRSALVLRPNLEPHLTSSPARKLTLREGIHVQENKICGMCIQYGIRYTNLSFRGLHSSALPREYFWQQA